MGTCLAKLRSLWLDHNEYAALPADARLGLRAAATARIDADFAEHVRGGVLLDLGCGPPGARGAAHDLAPAVYLGLDGRIAAGPTVVGDLGRLPLAEGAVDAVNCLSVLEHVFEPRPAIAEMGRVLAPGGLVRVQVPFLLQYHGYPDDYCRYTHSALRRLFEEAGFRVLLVETDWTKGTYLNAAKVLEDGSYDFVKPWRRLLTRCLALALFHASAHLDRHYAPGRVGQYQSVALLARKPGVGRGPE